MPEERTRAQAKAKLLSMGYTSQAAEEQLKGWEREEAPRKPVSPEAGWMQEVIRLHQMGRSRQKIMEEVATFYPETPIGKVVDYLNTLGAR